jgi:hypothetical protein
MNMEDGEGSSKFDPCEIGSQYTNDIGFLIIN